MIEWIDRWGLVANIEELLQENVEFEVPLNPPLDPINPTPDLFNLE